MSPFDAGRSHQPARLVPADDPSGATRGFPELADPIDAVVVLPQCDQLRGEDRVADGTRGRGAVLRGVVRARGHLQQRADGLDSERSAFDDVVCVRVDERDYFRCWRSSSAPKKLPARFRISFARRSSRFSCSSSRIRLASEVLTPGA